jgi:GDP-D-mannose dehydratase
MTMTQVLITGVTGLDGVCIYEFLLNKGYEVHSIKTRPSLFNTDCVGYSYQDRHENRGHFFLHHHGDTTDS